MTDLEIVVEHLQNRIVAARNRQLDAAQFEYYIKAELARTESLALESILSFCERLVPLAKLETLCGLAPMDSRDEAQIKGLPVGMHIQEIMHLEVEPSTGIMYGQVILKKGPL